MSHLVKKRKEYEIIHINRIPLECLAIIYRFLPEWERWVGIGCVNRFYRWVLKTSNLIFFKIQDFNVALGGVSINTNQPFPTVDLKHTGSPRPFPPWIINFSNVKRCCVYKQDGIFNNGFYHDLKRFIDAMPQLRRLWFIEVYLSFFNRGAFPLM